MNIAKKYQDFYSEHADKKKAEFDRGLVQTAYEIKGVRTSELERFAKELGKEEVDLSALPLNCHEDILLKGFLIAKKKDIDKEKELSALLPFIDNWATCDMIVSRIKNIISPEFFIKLLQNGNPFYKRVGIVWLKNNRLKTNLTETLEQILSVEDENYYVKMAKAWAMADAFAISFDQTFEFLKNCKDVFVVQKSISKACESFRVKEEDKRKLKEFKRGKKNAG